MNENTQLYSSEETKLFRFLCQLISYRHRWFPFFTLLLFHLVLCVFIITDKTKLVVEEAKGVDVMKDEERKLEEIEASHTLGG